MKLFKQAGNNNLFQIQDLTEEELIAFFNVSINYKEYLQEILKQPKEDLKKIAPGTDINQIRHNLHIQDKACADYISMWNTTINKGKKQE